MNSLKYFFDTEFIEDGKTIDLISIGIVSEDDRTLYLQNTECGFTKATDWVWRNVFPSLIHFDMRGTRACHPQRDSIDSGLGTRITTACYQRDCCWATHFEICQAVLAFCNVEKYGKPEFWGYYADYDWVALCQLFGPMINLPKGWPMYCRDIKQLCVDRGDPKLPPNPSEHNALIDANWNHAAWKFLMNLPRP